MSVDPLAEARLSVSPFNYVQNNPILRIDPNGALDDYFDEDGKYLYTDTQESNNVRIINRKDWNKIEAKHGEALENQSDSNLSLLSDLESSSSLLIELDISPSYLGENSGNLSGSAAVSIVNHYYEKVGYNLNELEGGSAINSTESVLASMGYNEETGKLRLSINRGSFGSDLVNKNDFVNMVIHERQGHGTDHLKGLKYIPGKNNWDWEKRATRIQVNHSSWQGTSSGFKNAIYSVYGKYKYIFSPAEQKQYFGKYGVKVNPQ